MNKKLILVLSLTLVAFTSFAQYKEDETEAKKGFQKEKLFTGGSAALSLGSGITSIGLSPHFGYSLTNWLDAAVSLNFNYISQRDVTPEGNDKLRQTTLGPGAFVRLFPVKFLFAQAQYEHNFIKRKYLPAPNSIYLPYKGNFEANSLLIGAGFASARSPGNNNYYYLSLMFDVLSSPDSPYRDSYGRVLPILKAGYNIALFQGKKNR